ncbi:hypothetical protein D3C73_1294560 [compost metagenome]
MHRDARRLVGQFADWLIHRHGLGTGDNALHRRQIGILTGNSHLARQALRGQRLDSAAGGGIVGSHYRVNLVIVGGQRIFHDF